MATLARTTRTYLRPDGRIALTWAVTGPGGAVHLQVELEAQPRRPDRIDGPQIVPGWDFYKAFIGRHSYVRLTDEDGEREDCDVLPPGCGGACFFSALDSYGESVWREAMEASLPTSPIIDPVEVIWRELAQTYVEAFNVAVTP